MFHMSSHKADSRKRNHCGSRLFIVPGSFFWPINSLLIIVNSSLYFIIHHIPGTCQRFTFVLLYSMENRAELGRSRMYNSGGSREGALLPSFIFRPNRGPKSRKKNWDPTPHLRVWMTVPSSLIWRSKSAAVLKAQLLNFSQFEKRHLEPGDFPHWHCVRSHCLARSVILMNFSKYQQTKPN